MYRPTVIVCLCLLSTYCGISTSFPTNGSSLVSRLFPQNNLFLNIQQLATLAMNPVIDNQTLTELYQEASEITNTTGADSVLLELDPVGSNSSDSDNLLVLAVTNPNVPTHEDLLRRFRLYFVNLTESSPTEQNVSKPLKDVEPVNGLPKQNATSMWDIFQNFLKNQANAVIGALMMPLNVGAKAALNSANQHAEYVMTGSAFGSAISTPVILKAVSIPNLVAQRIVDLTSLTVSAVESAEQQSKQNANTFLDVAANGLSNGPTIVSQVTNQFVVRPVGAFTGFNLNLAGNTLANFGQGISFTGLQMNLIGDSLNSGAEKAVSAGAKAIAWGLDETVDINGSGSVVQNAGDKPKGETSPVSK